MYGFAFFPLALAKPALPRDPAGTGLEQAPRRGVDRAELRSSTSSQNFSGVALCSILISALLLSSSLTTAVVVSRLFLSQVLVRISSIRHSLWSHCPHCVLVHPTRRLSGFGGVWHRHVNETVDSSIVRMSK